MTIHSYLLWLLQFFFAVPNIKKQETHRYDKELKKRFFIVWDGKIIDVLEKMMANNIFIADRYMLYIKCIESKIAKWQDKC